MALTKIRGYQIALTFNSKTVVGTTADTFAGGGVLKESIQKSDQGIKTSENFGFEGTISVSAFVHSGAAGGTEMGMQELLEASKANTSGAFVLAFGTAGSPKATGTAYINSVSVNSNSEDYADCTIECRILAKPTYGTV